MVVINAIQKVSEQNAVLIAGDVEKDNRKSLPIMTACSLVSF